MSIHIFSRLRTGICVMALALAGGLRPGSTGGTATTILPEPTVHVSDLGPPRSELLAVTTA
jgi:hypothetical protein